MQQSPQYPFPPPQRPLPHQRFWRWFRQRSKRMQIIACVVLILSCSLCGYISTTSANTSVVPTAATPTATQDVAAITTKIAATATQYAQNYQATANAAPTATPIPTASPTATATPKSTPKPTQVVVQPTPKPTQRPLPTPTPKPHCAGVNGNPWCYDFNPGNLIYYPPSGFCNYFSCIASFYGSDDPGDGYIVECQDSTFSQSGSERGACSYHGGVSRPLYSH
jgi:type II secretory pathway pseudopilin PulG